MKLTAARILNEVQAMKDSSVSAFRDVPRARVCSFVVRGTGENMRHIQLVSAIFRLK